MALFFSRRAIFAGSPEARTSASLTTLAALKGGLMFFLPF